MRLPRGSLSVLLGCHLTHLYAFRRAFPRRLAECSALDGPFATNVASLYAALCFWWAFHAGVMSGGCVFGFLGDPAGCPAAFVCFARPASMIHWAACVVVGSCCTSSAPCMAVWLSFCNRPCDLCLSLCTPLESPGRRFTDD